MRQRSARLGAGVIAAALFFTACTSADSNDPVRGGTLRVGVVGLASLDPALADEPTEALVAEMLFTPLVGLNRRTQEPGPALAARWSVNDDQTRFEFTLRQGLEFSNGDPITAADVKTTLDRVATPANESPLAGLLAPVAGFAEVASGAAEDLSGIEATDSRTVVITLSTPFAALPSVLANPGLGIVSAKGLDDLGTDPITSGPFEMASADDGNYKLRRADPDARLPRVAKVRLIAYEDDAAAQKALKDGKVDVVRLGAGDEVPSRSLEYGAPYLATAFYAIDLENPKFADVRFREAIIRALDADGLVQAGYPRAGLAADGLFPDGVLGGPRDQCKGLCDHDLEAAKQLLAEAFPDGAIPTVGIDFDDNPTQVAIAERAIAQLATAGIPAVARPHPQESYAEFLVNGDPDLFRSGIVGLFTSEDAFLSPWFISGAPENVARIAVPEVDAAVTEARLTGDAGERVDLYGTAGEGVLTTYAVLPVVQFVTRYATSRSVRALTVDPFGGFDATTVWIRTAS